MKYKITIDPQFMGMSHCGAVYSEGFEGTVELSDEEVQKLVQLIRDNGGETDVEALGLAEKLPEIYTILDDAYFHLASSEAYNASVIEGWDNGYLERAENFEELCEQNGFWFEPSSDDPDDYDQEYQDALSHWVSETINSLEWREKAEMLWTLYDCHDVNPCDYMEYTVKIPEEIIKSCRV